MDDNNKDLLKFSLSIYGDIAAYNEVLSKARCRIFYKYGNRNNTYITDEFADKLISTLPYVPVKGIYDYVGQDYTDHGKERYEGRIYGIVPENPNFAWEKHLDEDGVEREYACADVLLFTGIYKEEALEIVQKAQSMELYTDSIDGEWKFIDGKKYFVFTEGSFLGLQALGDKYEPCFEGAAFYTLYNSVQNLLEQIEQFKLQENKNGGENHMTFKLSDNQKYNMIWTLLNPRWNEEDGYIMDYCICDVYDEYAIVFNVSEGGYERAYYIKNDESDSLEITEKEAAYIMDVNETEKQALNALRALNNNTFEKIDETMTNLQQDVESFSQKIEEQEVEIATLKQEKDKAQSELEQFNENYSASLETIKALEEQKEELVSFKNEVLLKEKEATLDRYSAVLDAEVISTFKEKIDDLSNEELNKELAFALVQASPTLFTHNEEESGYAPKDDTPIGGVESILSRYKK